MMLRPFLFVFILISINFSLSAQDNAINEYATLKYNNTFSAGITLHSNGWGITSQYLLSKKTSLNMVTNLDVLSLKHPKETKVINPDYNNARPYVYGRINSIIVLHPGIGNQFIIADRENPNSIKVNLNFVAGPDIAIQKPDYLTIAYHNMQTDKPEYKIERYNPNNPYHQDQGNIVGGSSYFRGINKISTVPGFFAKASISFDWSDYDPDFKMIEAGIMIDAFPEPLNIFSQIENKSLFINLFINGSLGKRW